MSRLLALLVGMLVAAATGGARAQPVLPDILTFRLSMSNVHAIRGARTILVDAGGKGDLPRLEAALAAAGLSWPDIAAVVVTHGHSDHTGLAAEIRRRSGARILFGRGDVAMAQAGRNDELQPTNFVATLLKQFAIDPVYEGFQADQVIDGVTRLEAWGIAGQVRPLPGHTPGSLVVELDDGRSFVGDMVLGGFLGGAWMPQRAGEHYFHADRLRNLDNIRTLLRGPARVFYVGHGGPVTRESVAEAFGTGETTPAAPAR
jgi:glyoxylase-like metal-dependent hydrolase (beta-lactamase superfamily II)